MKHQHPENMENHKEIEAAHMKRQFQQTAAQRYADHRNDIAILVDCIQMELAEHARRAAEKPKDWGFVGDLADIRKTMKGVLESLLIGRYDWSAIEASRFIADHLEAMRQDRK